METASLHGGEGFWVLHKRLPDKGGAQIFCHEQTYAEIDADDVGVVPEQVGMEGVAEAIAAPGVFAKFFAEGTENANAVTGEEWKRSG